MKTKCVHPFGFIVLSPPPLNYCKEASHHQAGCIHQMRHDNVGDLGAVVLAIDHNVNYVSLKP